MRALVGTIGLLGMFIAPMFVLASFSGAWSLLLALLVFACFMFLYLTVY